MTNTKALTSTNIPFAATLDSGTSYTILPADIFDQLVQVFQPVQDTSDGSNVWYVDCDISKTKGTLDYQFGGQGGPIISVPFSELAVPFLNFTTEKPVLGTDGKPVCIFGLGSDASGLSILFGDTFLRSAYVVYDLDGNQVYIAQTNFDAKTSNVVEMTADEAAGAGGNGSAGGSTSIPAISGAQSTYSATHISGVGGSIVQTAPGAGATLTTPGLSSVAAPPQSGINTAGLSGITIQTTSLASHTFNFPSAASGGSASATSAAAAASSSGSGGSGMKSGVASVRLGTVLQPLDTFVVAVLAGMAITWCTFTF